METNFITTFLEKKFKSKEQIKKVLLIFGGAMLLILALYGVGIIPTPQYALIRVLMLLPIFGIYYCAKLYLQYNKA